MKRFPLGGLILAAIMLVACSRMPAITDFTQMAEQKKEPIHISFSAGSQEGGWIDSTLAPDSAEWQSVMDILQSSTPLKRKPVTSFSPEVDCDCIIRITSAEDASILTVYYWQSQNLFTLSQSSTARKATLRYSFYTPPAAMNTLLEAQRTQAGHTSARTDTTTASQVALISSILPDDLVQEGTEIGFEFYGGTLLADDTGLCRIYTSADIQDLPADKLLILAQTRDVQGDITALSIQGIEVNAVYTKILVTATDPSSDDGDVPDDDSTDAVSPSDNVYDNIVVVAASDIPKDKWIVFVDDKGIVQYVISKMQ